MKGSTFKRCTMCHRVVKGRGCTTCRTTAVTWGYVADIGRDGTGRRRQRRRTRFATRAEAEQALTKLVDDLDDTPEDIDPTVTVGAYLTEQWLPAVQPPHTRESTWSEYSRMVRLHLEPRLGQVGMHDLNPSHLNRTSARSTRGSPTRIPSLPTGSCRTSATPSRVWPRCRASATFEKTWQTRRFAPGP